MLTWCTQDSSFQFVHRQTREQASPWTQKGTIAKVLTVLLHGRHCCDDLGLKQVRIDVAIVVDRQRWLRTRHCWRFLQGVRPPRMKGQRPNWLFWVWDFDVELALEDWVRRHWSTPGLPSQEISCGGVDLRLVDHPVLFGERSVVLFLAAAAFADAANNHDQNHHPTNDGGEQQ